VSAEVTHAVSKEPVIVALIDQQQFVQQSADALQEPVREALKRLGSWKDVLHGKWLGHPLHPVLTDIPVGAWTTALALDAAEMMTEKEGFGDAADLAIGIGVAGAVASAVTGLTDWSETDGRAKNVGMVHGILNLAATGLYTASLIARRGKSRRNGVALSLLGYAIASFSAYLGGHLVFGEQVGVDHTATPDQGQPKKFTPVMAEGELKEKKPVRVDVEDTAVLLVRIGGEIHALSNTCAHLGGPLNEGKLEGDCIRCPWHGSLFALSDGKVLEGPATYDERVFEVRVRDGQIEIRARD
jgi:nitrite reductase/ring-hydroxylating ferredoxin subunit/uncharacterized membrane protein